MPASSGRVPRLFIDHDLAAGTLLPVTPEHAHYLVNVLRRSPGDPVHVFNGRDGEWETAIADAGKKRAILNVIAPRRPQESGPDIDYLFAPIKRARIDFLVQKATEMGAARLRPVITRFTQAERLNVDRMRANAIEAAEQCGGLRVPTVLEPTKLDRALDDWKVGDANRRIVFCDEAAPNSDPVSSLASIPRGTLMAVLIGPEGGFAPEERERLHAHPAALALSLGPRILRADTAGIAALALVNAVCGDWGSETPT